MIKLRTKEQDDQQFVELVSAIVAGAIVCYQPKAIYVVQIDGWFDHKWQYFSGVIDLQFGTWHSPLTPPPFHPNRVIDQLYFHTEGTTPLNYVAGEAKPLHIKQHSWSNRHRRIRRITESGLFLWYSGETGKSDRASIMLYHVEQEAESCWYASLIKKDSWKWNKVKGTSKQELEGIIRMAAPA
jgi:hypothetical protein